MNIVSKGLLACVAVVAFAAAVSGLLDWRAGKAYERIKLGDKEALVLGYLGGPSKTDVCPDTLWWDDESLGPNAGQCVRWSVYENVRSTWGVGYSKEAKVVAKHKYPRKP